MMNVRDTIAKLFQLPDNRLVDITEHIVREFGVGLEQESRDVAMIPSFVTRVPNGTAEGSFLSVGISWATLRVSRVELHGNRKAEESHKIFDISKQLMSAEATEFFDFMANCVNTFLKENNISNNGNEALPIALIFPFPVHKTALNEAKITGWSKGYAVKNAVGKDVIKLLQDAFDRKRMHVRCVALINDTVAELLSQSYSHNRCDIAAIFGIGTNGAYIENIARITKLQNSPYAASGGEMIVNTEWGAYNDRSVLPVTVYDEKTDETSFTPGLYMLQKMTSWMYAGEIARNLIVSLVESSPSILFNGSSTSKLNTSHAHGFNTRHMSSIEAAKSLQDVKQIIVDSLGFASDAVSDRDAEIMRWACEQVGTRAAKLSGCSIAAALIQSGYKQARVGGERKFLVAISGEMIMFYPQFEARVRHALCAILGDDVEKRVDIVTEQDHDAIGAAVCLFGALHVRK